MHVHQRACAFAIDVQVADMEVAPSAFQAVAFGGIERASQPVDRVIGNVQSLVHIFGFDDGQHRTEDFFLRDAGFRINVSDDGGLDEEAFAGHRVAFAANDGAAFLFANFDVVADLLERALARYRAGEVADVFDIADG